MKRSIALLLPLALIACQDTSQPVALDGRDPGPLRSTQAASADPVVPGELIVKLRDGADFAQLAREHGLKLERVGFANRFAVLRGTPGSEYLLAERIAADSRVVYAEPNYLRQPHGVGTIDPRLWAFYNPGGLKVFFRNDPNGRDGQEVASLYSVKDADMDADYAGNAGFAAGGSPVVISSLDTGVDMNHPELAGRLIAGRDWVDNDSDPSDTDGHGTHTTGTMAGLHVGVAGVAGAASNIKVFVQRVCSANGCPTSAIVDAIYAAANFNDNYPGQPPMVAMNLSLGGPIISQSERDAINYAVNTKGVLVIASAGNDGRSRVSCPACDSNSISVAATDWMDQHAYYTNYGSGLDISAPGGELYSNTTAEAGILSAVPGNYNGSDRTTGPITGAAYAFYQGTSMAAPQVTGVAAIVASKTGLRGAALRSRLEGTADDLGAKGYDTSFGNGRVNAYRAVTQTTLDETGGGTPPPPPPPPTNQAPKADFTYSCSNSATCSFTDRSSDPDGTVTAWSWNFGNGNTSTAQNPTNTYSAAGSFTVTQTVTDNGGLTASTSRTITCQQRPLGLRCS